ncbi:MAG: gluconokinase [Chitinophagaceae bacterium]
MQNILAIDIGTTHCKAIIVNEKGNAIYSVKKNVSIIQDQSEQSEQDPHEIFQVVLSLIQQSFSANKNISAVCFSAAMHSIIAIDENCTPLTNAIIWADTRSKLYAEKLLKNKKANKIFQQTGTPIHPMSPLCKIIWMKNELPEIFKNTYKFISIKEYIFYRLFGRFIVDYSIASATGLFDIYNLKWFEPALKIAGISENNLSTPVSVIHAEMQLLPEFQSIFQHKKNIPFIVGANDGCLANLGCGAINKGEAAITIGTSGAVRMMNKTRKSDPQKRLFNYLLTDKIFISGGPTNNGGNVLEWFTENFLNKNSTVEETLKLAAQADYDVNGLIFLPYLFGERAPIWNANAEGVFFGLTNLHTKKYLARAVIEGICFSVYDIIKSLEETNKIETVYATGGFIASKSWLQLMANIFGKKIIVCSNNDASAMGAAFMGMYALKIIDDLFEAKKFLKREKTFYPDKKMHVYYKKLFAIFKSLYVNLKDEFESLSSLQMK